jgi:hypothetical protein
MPTVSIRRVIAGASSRECSSDRVVAVQLDAVDLLDPGEQLEAEQAGDREPGLAVRVDVEPTALGLGQIGRPARESKVRAAWISIGPEPPPASAAESARHRTASASIGLIR